VTAFFCVLERKAVTHEMDRRQPEADHLRRMNLQIMMMKGVSGT
jgi:hypothetical protein